MGENGNNGNTKSILKSMWTSEVLRSVVLVLTAIAGATGIQIAAPARSDPFTGTEGKDLALQIHELRSDIQVLRLEMEANRKLLLAELRQIEQTKPPIRTRERIESIEDYLDSKNDYQPPHRRWHD